MKAEITLEGLDGVLKTLQSLPHEVTAKRGGVVLRALRTGARVIQKEARTNFARNISTAGKTGINWGTGFTQKNIITKRGRMTNGVKGEKVIVTVRQALHPSGNRFRKKPLQANDLAFAMEYGTSKQAAEPWIRPAFAAKAEQAARTVESDLLKQIAKVVAKLAAQNKGK